MKAQHVLAALLRIGWTIKRQTGSHKILQRDGWPMSFSHFTTA
jgi:predicted RNA binding protein YcfA (HicA-like mRNA interferase family)